METKLSQRMAALGFTDKSLSEKTGIERSVITKMRLGKITPSLKRAVLICDITGVRPEDLLPNAAGE